MILLLLKYFFIWVTILGFVWWMGFIIWRILCPVKYFKYEWKNQRTHTIVSYIYKIDKLNVYVNQYGKWIHSGESVIEFILKMGDDDHRKYWKAISKEEAFMELL